MEQTTSTAATDNACATGKVTAEPAEAEKKMAAAGLGKFGSVDALIAAYSGLEAEFTRRSQRLKELEEGNKAQNMPAEGAPSPKPEELLAAALKDDDVRNAVIGQYLKGLTGGQSVPLVVGGVSSAAPRIAPKTVKEAGTLAQEFLKYQ